MLGKVVFESVMSDQVSDLVVPLRDTLLPEQNSTTRFYGNSGRVVVTDVLRWGCLYNRIIRQDEVRHSALVGVSTQLDGHVVNYDTLLDKGRQHLL